MSTYMVTSTDGLRLRAHAGTAAGILETLANGARVVAVDDQTRDADGYTWRHVRAPSGAVGWVADQFLARRDGDDGHGHHGGTDLTDEADYEFGFAALWPYIQASAAEYGADPQVIAAIMCQESGFTNWRVHRDGTGHGLFGLDDNGLLPDFEQWSGVSCGRGHGAISIPPGLQIDYCAKTIAALTQQYGSAYNAARVWHRGPGLWGDARGDNYESLVRSHIRRLFG